jgi:hypothetical protein
MNADADDVHCDQCGLGLDGDVIEVRIPDVGDYQFCDTDCLAQWAATGAR